MKFTGQVLISALFFSTSAFGAAVWNVKNLDKRITVVARDTEGNFLYERAAPNCQAYFCEDATDCLASGGESGGHANCPSCAGDPGRCSFI
ncbi:hypothetical protein B0J12DRAFT_745908 [Macrophomina phaseolina]|uniref:Uncharacterized protein n=1 Tax=Macrophomina phaseolina TaxID=35725 RepID=A0ABQ8FU34_9PEZI|nr:hypothetical protein B0J12DRAFT_745908 [Macrophomina phaseolina]